MCLVALLLAGRVASVGHMVLTRHVQCSHGELVHFDPDHSPRAVNLVQPVVDDVVLRRAHSPVSSHEHCHPPAVFDGVVQPAGPTLAYQLIDWQLLARSLGPAAFQRSIAILTLAPKSSPPRV